MSTRGGHDNSFYARRRRARRRGRGAAAVGPQVSSSPAITASPSTAPSPAFTASPSPSPGFSFGHSHHDMYASSSTGGLFGSTASVPEPKGQVVGFLASLNDDTDLTIKLDGHTWKVHSNLMGARSPFFEAMCSGKWKESEEKVVQLSDDSPRIFARFLQFVYCDDYEGNFMVTSLTSNARTHLTVQKLLATKKVTTTQTVSTAYLDQAHSVMMTHIQVYELADKYLCQDLQDLARKNICKNYGPQELENLRAMIGKRNLKSWKDLAEKDQVLKKIFAEKIAANYKVLKASVVTEQSTQAQANQRVGTSTSLNEWLRWMEEDNVFCMMVVDAMSQKLP